MNGIDPREMLDTSTIEVDTRDYGCIGVVGHETACEALYIQAEQYEAKIKGLHALINVQASRIRDLEANVPYTNEKCMRTHVQDCTRCDFIECGDNQSDSGQLVGKLEREIKRLKEGWMETACQLIQGSQYCDEYQTEYYCDEGYHCQAVRNVVDNAYA